MLAAFSDIAHHAFVIHQRPVWGADSPRIFRDPDALTVSTIDFGFKIDHLTIVFNQTLEFGAASRIDIQVVFNIGQTAD